MSKQVKLINLKKLTHYLINDGVPNLLQENLSTGIIDQRVKLRLFPLSLPIIPTISGHHNYCTCLSTLRLLCNKFLLDNPNDHSIRHKLHIISFDQIQAGNICGFDNNLFITNNDKLIIKWQTYNERLHLDQFVKLKQNELLTDIKHNRLIKGQFIFEFNNDNTKLLIHTLENIEFYHKKNKDPTTSISMC